MLCMNNPWDKEVRRLRFDTRLLPTVQPPAMPEPFALTLDNAYPLPIDHRRYPARP
jgi:hypothetical protein